MVAVLAILFLVVPIVELAVIVKVAGVFGLGSTLLLLIAVSVVGAWLVKREGIGVIRRVRATLDQGELPHREVLDGALILLAGVLMLTPGFVTDVLGLVLLFPPTRLAVRTALLGRFKRQLHVRVISGVSGGAGWGRVHDVRGQDVSDGAPGDRPELDRP